MPKTLSVQVPDSVATELLTKRTTEEWKEFLKEVIACELRDIRSAVAEAAKPSVEEPDKSLLTADLK